MLRMSLSRRLIPGPRAATAGLLAGALLLCGGRPALADSVTPLLETGTTVLGQTFSYPTTGPAKVTVVLVDMQPGEETPWHTHGVPLLGYMLEGELTVDYGAHGTRVYRKGDAAIEAIDVAHKGRNTGSGVARILAVFIGADGVANSTKVAPPPQ